LAFDTDNQADLTNAVTLKTRPWTGQWVTSIRRIIQLTGFMQVFFYVALDALV